MKYLFFACLFVLSLSCQSDDVKPDYYGNYVVFGGFVETPVYRYEKQQVISSQINLTEKTLSVKTYVGSTFVAEKVNSIYIDNITSSGFDIKDGNTVIAIVQKQKQGYYLYTYFTQYSDYFKLNVKVWLDAGKDFQK